MSSLICDGFSDFSLEVEFQMSPKWSYCKNFYSEAGRPFGINCMFLHSEISNDRVNVVTSVGPGGSQGGRGGYGRGVTRGFHTNSIHYKTKLCHKFEIMGFCPFGAKCRFAHGSHELLLYGGLVVPCPDADRIVVTALINNRPMEILSRPSIQNSTVGYVCELAGSPIKVPPKTFSVSTERLSVPLKLKFCL